MATAGYDAGKATEARLLADGRYVVPSFRAESKEYLVDLSGGTCTCPQHTIRGLRCKHLIACESQAKFIQAAERAKELTDHALDAYLTKYATNPTIGGALRVERARRKQAQRPPVGTSVKTFGPTTDREAFGK